MSGNGLPKVIDKSQADIDAAIAAIKASDIPSGTKDFAISCIKLAVWLPTALLEHKIKLSNLRKLIFGLGRRNKKSSKNDTSSTDKKDYEKSDDSTATNSTETKNKNTSAPDTTNQLPTPSNIT